MSDAKGVISTAKPVPDSAIIPMPMDSGQNAGNDAGALRKETDEDDEANAFASTDSPAAYPPPNFIFCTEWLRPAGFLNAVI